MQNTLMAQEGVVGSLLVDPQYLGEALSRVHSRDFLSDRCRVIFQTMREMFAAGETVDPVTVRGRLALVGGEDWGRLLIDLMDITPTARNIWAYVALMKDQARIARIRDLAAELNACADLDDCGGIIAKLNGELSQRPGVQRMNMEQMLLNFYERQAQEHVFLTWGLDRLNDRLYTELGDMVVLGGYPSAGKTALAVGFAWHMAAERRVGFYSLETSQYKLADRLIASLADIDLGDIKHGQIADGQWERLAGLSTGIRARRLELVHAGGMTVADIQADALSRRYEVIFVDYLQIVVQDGHSRTEAVTKISLGLHQLSQREGITVVALSQLSRPEKKGEAELAPTMRDLRESGQIEQDADAVMLLYLEQPNSPAESRRVLAIAKNKEGERGKLFLDFDGAHQRFHTASGGGPGPGSAQRGGRRKPPPWWLEEEREG